MYVHDPAFIKLHEVINQIPVKKLNSSQLTCLARVVLTEVVNRAKENGNTKSLDHLCSIFITLDEIDEDGFIDMPRGYFRDITD